MTGGRVPEYHITLHTSLYVKMFYSFEKNEKGANGTFSLHVNCVWSLIQTSNLRPPNLTFPFQKECNKEEEKCMTETV